VTRPRLLALLLAAGAASLATAQEPMSFEAAVELVRIDVVVERGGRWVEGLGAGDFEVLDNGVPQQVEVLGPGSVEAAVHAVLVLDTSGSTAGERLDKLRAASRAFLGGLDERDTASLLGASERLDLVSELEHDRLALYRALEGAKAGGATALHDAIFLGLTLADPRVGRPVLLVFTDGADNVSWMDAEPVSAMSRRTEAVVYVILETPQLLQVAALGHYRVDDDTRFLLDVAEDSGGRLWHARSLDDLSTDFLRVLDEVRHRYVLRYQPKGVEAGGWHDLQVRLVGTSANVRARRGYERRTPDER
jgi:VWFA-related protein